MSKQRTINNNPTGKPFCCAVGCDRDAAFNINFGDGPDDYTQSCDEHLASMAQHVHPYCHVTPIAQQ